MPASSENTAKKDQGSGTSNVRAVQRGLGAVVIRNEFYRDGYRVLQSIAVMQAIIICVLIFIMLYVVHIHQPENRYFATTEDGRLVPMVPLNEPNLSTPAITSWAAQAATEAMTFASHDYRRRMQDSSRNFTRKGYQEFLTALTEVGIFNSLQTGVMIVTAAPAAAPVVIQEGTVRGRYQWTIRMVLAVTYRVNNTVRSEQNIVDLLIVRTPQLESPSGIGIEQWVAQK